MSTSQNPNWWRNAVVYQVYIRSFADGNGDGMGDIRGIRSRVGYLSKLGVDAIWINPWYTSPLNDGGYDVADYRNVDPRFGTLDEAVALIEEANEAGIRVMVDLVPNHTSSAHRWFQQALADGPGSEARDKYHFRLGRGDDGEQPPTNWTSVFGGSTWTRVEDGEWYLHLFDPSQPDLNWDSEDVRSEFHDILRFWLDRGAAGFRIDVAHGLVKADGFPDAPVGADGAPVPKAKLPFWDQDGVHEIIRGWRAVTNEYPGSVMVAEAWVPDWERLARYLRPDEYHQVFDFEFLESPWRADSMKKAISESLESSERVGSIPTWVLSNHDVVRHATRYGLPQDVHAKSWLLDGDRTLLDTDLGVDRARAAILLMLALPGSVYLYQGEELALPEAYDLPDGVLDDPVWRQSEHTEKGRDGCRVPIPWTDHGPSLGFGDSAPWLPQPASYASYAASVQDGVPGSTLELYRTAISLRADLLGTDEQFEWEPSQDGTIAFRRSDGFTCIVNFSAEPVTLPAGEVVLASADVTTGTLPPNSSAWITTP